VSDEDREKVEKLVKAFEVGYLWGLEQNEEDHLGEVGGSDPIYPPPNRAGGAVFVDPAIFRGDIDALTPPEDFEPEIELVGAKTSD
jgi:hypothetical protein